MVKKLYALASVTALGGLVAAVSASGCSSTEIITQPGDSGVGDAKRDVTQLPPEDAAPAETCLEPKEIDATTVPYKPPAIKLNVCDTAALKVIDDLIAAKPKATFADLKQALTDHSAPCANCVFGPDGDTWPVIVENGDKIVALNLGGCVGIVSGKEACGKAYQQWDLCLDSACQTCPDAEKSDCSQGAQGPGKACGKASTALEEACGSNVNTFIQTCFKQGELTIKGPITQQCIGGSIKDAGNDG